MAFDNIHQKTISCRIPANIKARLDDICGENCKTIGELMRDMIREKYPEMKQPAIQTPTPATTSTTKQTPIKTMTETTKPTPKEVTKPTAKNTKTDTPTGKPREVYTETCTACGQMFTDAGKHLEHIQRAIQNTKHPRKAKQHEKAYPGVL